MNTQANPIPQAQNKTECRLQEQKVYVLEGDPNNVYDAQGNKLDLTPEQKQEILAQL